MSARSSMPPRELVLVAVVALTLTGSILAFAATAPDGSRSEAELIVPGADEGRLSEPSACATEGLASMDRGCDEASEPSPSLQLLELRAQDLDAPPPGIETTSTLLTAQPPDNPTDSR